MSLPHVFKTKPTDSGAILKYRTQPIKTEICFAPVSAKPEIDPAFRSSQINKVISTGLNYNVHSKSLIKIGKLSVLPISEFHAQLSTHLNCKMLVRNKATPYYIGNYCTMCVVLLRRLLYNYLLRSEVTALQICHSFSTVCSVTGPVLHQLQFRVQIKCSCTVLVVTQVSSYTSDELPFMQCNTQFGYNCNTLTTVLFCSTTP